VTSSPSSTKSSDVTSSPSSTKSSDVTSSPSSTKSSDMTSSPSSTKSSDVTSSPSSTKSSDVTSSPSSSPSSSASSSPSSSVSSITSYTPTAKPIIIDELNNQNQTEDGSRVNITEPLLSAIENQDSRSADNQLINNPSFIGAISGGVLLIAILAVAVAIFTYLKKKQKKSKSKPKKTNDESLEIKEVYQQENPYIQITPQEPTSSPLKVKALQHRRPDIFTITDSDLKAKHVFNPISATNKPIRQIQQLNVSKDITRAQVLDTYRISKDRLHTKRNSIPPSNNENRTGFTPIKKELKPQMARYTSTMPNLVTEIEEMNKLFNK
jgi:hypothetical protein